MLVSAGILTQEAQISLLSLVLTNVCSMANIHNNGKQWMHRYQTLSKDQNKIIQNIIINGIVIAKMNVHSIALC